MTAKKAKFANMTEAQYREHCANREKEGAERTALLRERMTVAFQQQDGKCCHCREPMVLRAPGTKGNPGKKTATAEHIKPEACGGTDDQENIAAACRSCNNSRGTIDFEIFQAIRSNQHAWLKHQKSITMLRSSKHAAVHNTIMSKLKLAVIALKACVPDNAIGV